MPEPVHHAFEPQVVALPIAKLLPLKRIPEDMKQSTKYKRIAQSIAEVGIIEPLVVTRSKEHKDCFLLLDGHVRYTILRESGHFETRCLIADDDEVLNRTEN